MAISIDFYILSRELKSAFKTSRGEVSQKEILILIFQNHFAFELPLTPSNGELPRDVLLHAHKGNLSKMTKIALSYYHGWLNDPFFFLTIEPEKQFYVYTYAINNTDYKAGEYLYRFKASIENMDQIIEWSNSNNKLWTVDFNEGLTTKEFMEFLSGANLSNCLFIEQPLPGTQPVPPVLVPIWTDEGLKDLTPKTFFKTNFSGFMLKPLNFYYKDFIKWVIFAQKNKIPFFISGVVSDNLFHLFINHLNKTATWQYITENKAGFFKNELNLTINPYTSNNFDEVISLVKKEFEFAANLKV